MSQLLTQEAELQATCQKCLRLQLNAHKKGLWEFSGTCFSVLKSSDTQDDLLSSWNEQQSPKFRFSFAALITNEKPVAAKLLRHSTFQLQFTLRASRELRERRRPADGRSRQTGNADLMIASCQRPIRNHPKRRCFSFNQWEADQSQTNLPQNLSSGPLRRRYVWSFLSYHMTFISKCRFQISV